MRREADRGIRKLANQKDDLEQFFHHGFKLTERELRIIYDTLIQQMNRSIDANNFITTFEVKYKNYLTEKKDAENPLAAKELLEQLLLENNGGEWAIQSLKIRLYDTKTLGSSTRIALSFENNSYVPINYYILGNDREWVKATNNKIEERIAKIKRIKLIHNTMVSKIEVALLIIILLMPFPLMGSILLSRSFPISWLVIVIATLVLILLAISFRVISYFFPPYNFYWGDYVEIFDRRQNVGKFIITGVIIALMISITASIIANIITTNK